MKKAISAILSLSTALLVFAGCSAKPASTDATTSTVDSQSSSTEKVTLQFWHSMSGANGELTTKIVNAFNDSHPNIKVVATYAGGYTDASAKAQQAMFAGNGPDILQIGDDSIGQFASSFANLEPYMKKAGISDSDFVKALVQNEYYNKNLVAIPYGRSAQLLYVNKTVLDSVNAKIPTTWDELSDVANKCVVKDSSGTVTRYGISFPFDQWELFALVQQAGGSFFNAKNTELGFVSNGIGNKVFTYLKNMQKTGALYYNNSTNDQNNNMFTSGKAAMCINSSGGIASLTKAVAGKFQIVVAPLVKGKVNSMPTGGCDMGILNAGKHKAQAWEFLKFFIQDKTGGLAFVLGSGYLPFTKQMVASTEIQDLWKSNSNFKTAYDALKYGDDRYRIGKTLPVITEFRTCIQAIMLDNKDINSSLTTFNSSVKTILKS